MERQSGELELLAPQFARFQQGLLVGVRGGHVVGHDAELVDEPPLLVPDALVHDFQRLLLDHLLEAHRVILQGPVLLERIVVHAVVFLLGGPFE